LKLLKTRGRDPAFIKLPERTLFDHYKSLAKEFIPRGLFTAKNISASSTLKFDWNCSVCGKRIKNVSVADRTRALDEARTETRGCYICAKRARIKRKAPVPLPQWLKDECIDEKNTKGRHFTPRQKLMSSHARELRLWCCGRCGFRFRGTVGARNAEKDPQGCPSPACFGEDEIVDLTLEIHAWLAKLFMTSPRNSGYIKLSHCLPRWHKVYWKCEKGHVRYASFKEVMDRKGCLTCYDLEHPSENLASQTYKELQEQFVCVLNQETFGPQDVLAKSNRWVVEWLCQESPHHRWWSTPVRRTSKVPFSGCPFCARRRVAAEESLVKTHPHIAVQWDHSGNEHPTKKRKITPDEVLATDRKMYDWICAKDHKYQASCKARTEKGIGCSRCLVLPDCLANTYPELAAQWHERLNEELGLTPFNTTPGSMKKIFWQCLKIRTHSWPARVFRRVKEGSGCPHCARQTHKSNSIYWTYRGLYPHYHKELNPKAAHFSPAGLDQIYWWHCFSCGKPYRRTVGAMHAGVVGCVSCRAKRRVREKLSKELGRL
jgi:hypothetical protein